MIESESTDAGDDRFGDDVGGIVQTANTDFEDGRFNAQGQEGMESEKGEKAEIDWEDWRMGEGCLSSVPTILFTKVCWK